MRVNAISPGGIKDSQEKKFIDKYKRHCNSKGLLSPEDINGLVNFLLSESQNILMVKILLLMTAGRYEEAFNGNIPL